jgi:lipid-A-disaccharide synthase
MRLLVSAGEPSGEAHAAEVITALRAHAPDTKVEGIGGRRMDAAGVRLLARSEDLSAMGLAEAAHLVPAHLRLLSSLGRRLSGGRYDAAMLVDYPGFNLRLARTAARAGVPVLYYIAPQLWAWGRWRLGALRRRVRRVAVILPFEETFFGAHGVPATFVGHPLLDRAPAPERSAARRSLGVDADAPLLALCPGSRTAEVRRMWPVMRAAARRAREAVPELEVVVVEAPCGVSPRDESFRVWSGDTITALAAADAGICKSGTTTLEAAVAGMPMVIAYRMHPVSFALARRVVHLRYVGLVNLIAGRLIAPEYLQASARPETMAQAVLPLLDREGAPARAQRDGFEYVRGALGAPGAAQRVAELVGELAA